MAEQTVPNTTAATAKVPTELWVERTGTRRYTGRSSRGAQVLIGSEGVEGVFSPGELLKIALAACTGLSSDFPLSNRLGDSYDATIRVSGAADRENEVYPELEEVLELDLSELDEAGRERLLVTVQRAIDKVCTVGRTLKAGTKVNLTFQVDA
ncbi:OsmC family protein [Nocardia wallacei]|uniref:OsmC family protein n=1 Tax=Nocardia wallacei TaxID=480035 RepID=UPI002456988E|nr:OsmC family protein [Nocardia wallacei]